MSRSLEPVSFLLTAALVAGCHDLRPASPAVVLVPAIAGLRIALHHQPATARGPGTGQPPVLFVHGATFPTALAAGYRFDGVSWMDDLAAQGFDVWGLDFLGYGRADRYPEMAEPADAHPPLGRADAASRQIAAAVAHIGAARVAIVAHSWGTIAAGRYAGEHPDQLARLVLFGPVARRTEPEEPSASPAWLLVSEADQRARFTGYVPAGQPPAIAPRHLAAWGPAYVASDPTSARRTPPAAQVPGGPIADLDAAWRGELPYDPARIIAPTLIVRGEWEVVTTDADARWLYDALTAAPLKRDVKIDRATHVMHLEASRRQLYREVSTFLAGGDR